MSSGACDWPSLTGHSRFDTCLLVRGHHKGCQDSQYSRQFHERDQPSVV